MVDLSFLLNANYANERKFMIAINFLHICVNLRNLRSKFINEEIIFSSCTL